MNNQVLLSVVSLITTLLSTHIRAIHEMSPSLTQLYKEEPSASPFPPMNNEEVMFSYTQDLTINTMDYALVTDHDNFRNYISAIEFRSMAQELLEPTQVTSPIDESNQWIPLTPEALTVLTSIKLSEMDKYYDDMQELIGHQLVVPTVMEPISVVNPNFPSYGYFDSWMLASSPQFRSLPNNSDIYKLQSLTRDFHESIQVVGAKK